MKTFDKLVSASSLALALGLSLASLTGCSDDDDPNGSGGSSGSSGSGGSGGSGGGGQPVYVLQTSIFSNDGILNYVVTSHDLDMTVDDAALATAREVEGYTSVDVIGGKVYAGHGTAPFVNRFEVGDDLKWNPTGELNFGAYPMDEYNFMNFYFQSFKNADDIYFFYGSDKTSRVHWSVNQWKIVGDHTDTNLPLPAAGWLLQNGGNRTDIRDYKGPVVQPFSQLNEATERYSDKSWLAVYDENSHVEKNVIEVPCPGIQQATMAENGDLYFSTTFSHPTPKLFNAGPAPCVVRVKADGTLDESFAPNDLTAFTGGFYGVNFRYLKDGKALANVLHHDRLSGLNQSGTIDPAVAERIDSDTTVWELHLIDLQAGNSKVVTGFKPEHDMDWYTISMSIEGKTFVIVSLSTEQTRSAVYELDANTATVSFVGESIGDIWGVSRLR